MSGSKTVIQIINTQILRSENAMYRAKKQKDREAAVAQAWITHQLKSALKKFTDHHFECLLETTEL